MKKEINTIDDLELGIVFKCSWGGMADFYKLIGKTKSSVKLIELSWETCSAPENENDSDPSYRWVQIRRDEKGNFIESGSPITKRIRNLSRGGISFNSPNYEGQATVTICNPNKKFHFYWG